MMNRAAMKRDRENQRRLMQELERLSEESSSSAHQNLLVHSMLDPDSLFIGQPFYSSSSVSSDPEDVSPGSTVLPLEIHSNDSETLSYEPMTPCHVSDEGHLQVDHTGAKVLQLPASSAWLDIGSLAEARNSVSISTSSSCAEKESRASPARVAAAATAAMIVVNEDAFPKRPRSPAGPDSKDEKEDEDDRFTETTFEETDDPSSPRSISGFPKETLVVQIDTQPPKGTKRGSEPMTSSLRDTPTPLTLCRTSNRSPSDDKKEIVSISLESAHDAATCRKRRAEAMERFRRKKAVRCYGRRVRYQIRKRIATTRPRVNGRFARRSDPESQVPVKPDQTA